MIMQEKNRLQEYLDIVRKVAKVEHRRIPAHMVEYEELLSIGIIAVQALIKNKTPEQLARYNMAYVATAVRWAIRNELRIRYKWYSMRLCDEAVQASMGACHNRSPSAADRHLVQPPGDIAGPAGGSSAPADQHPGPPPE